MRAVFVLRHAGFVRNFEWALRTLGSRGVSVELLLQHEHDEVLPRQLHQDHPNITFARAPARLDRWLVLAYKTRQSIDYLRYLTPMYRNAPKLRARAARLAPNFVVTLTRLPLLRSQPVLRLMSRILRAVDRALPAAREVDKYIHVRKPDIVLVTPLVEGPTQADWVRSAKSRGIATALPVTSWDNLTNKGLMRDVPDRVYVWNEIQRSEALELHGVPPERVVVVGAHAYDHWFSWEPSTSPEQFRAKVGLPVDRPFILYLCSSSFIAQEETALVSEWLDALRNADDSGLRHTPVLIRPHPSRISKSWEDFAPEHEDVVVWPPTGEDPRTPEAKRGYFDSLFHSRLVVGVNTTALIEAAIVGRKSYTFLHPSMKDTQEGTLHFHYLVEENGGPLAVAESLDDHVVQLAAAVGTEQPEDWNRPFLESFIRPLGLSTAGGPLLADEIEWLAKRGTVTPRTTIGQRVLRLLLFPLAVVSGRRAWRNALLPKEFRVESEQTKSERRAAKGPGPAKPRPPQKKRRREKAARQKAGLKQ